MHSGGVDSGGSVANWAVPSSSQKCAGKQKNVPKSMLTIWNRAGPEGHHFLGMVSLGEEYHVKRLYKPVVCLNHTTKWKVGHAIHLTKVL